MRDRLRLTLIRGPGILLLTAASFLALLLHGSCQRATNAEPTLDSISRDIGIALEGGRDFRVVRNLLRERGEKGYWTIEAGRGRQVIKIEILRGEDDRFARTYMEESKQVLRSLLTSMPSPYPGVISREISMPREHATKVLTMDVAGQPAEVFLLSGTERFTYGAKDEASIRYRGGVVFLHNAANRCVYRIDLFFPKEEYREADLLALIGSIRFLDAAAASTRPQTGPGPESAPARVEDRKSSPPGTATGSSGAMNLIVVGFEPLGARHVGAYGYARETTPNLDRFAGGAALFKTAVSPSSWTLPAFMSWFTSVYPSQHTLTNKYRMATMKEGATPELSTLPPGIVTLAQYLKGNGFVTAGFTGGAALSGDFGYRRGFDRYFDNATFGGSDTTFPKATGWLRANRGKRFFLFVQGFDVHGRFPLGRGTPRNFLPGEYRGASQGTVDEYWRLRDANLDNASFRLPEEDVAFWTAQYDAKIFEADRRFGSFLRDISELGLMENTVIIVSSGSGNEYFEHGGIDHGLTLYDELLLVPLIIRVPGIKGRVVESQVGTIDIMPTALDLLGVPPNGKVSSQMQGVSLAPVLRGGPLQRNVYSETDYLSRSFKRSIRTSDGWKYILSLESGKRELYDLGRDPGERANIIETEKAISDKLESQLLSHIEKTRTIATREDGKR